MVLVEIQVAVVRFVADVAGRRQWYDVDYFAVLWRLFVKIDDCKKIRCDLSLVLRPDIENLIGSSAVVVPVLRFATVFLPSALAVLSQRDG